MLLVLLLLVVVAVAAAVNVALEDGPHKGNFYTGDLSGFSVVLLVVVVVAVAAVVVVAAAVVVVAAFANYTTLLRSILTTTTAAVPAFSTQRAPRATMQIHRPLHAPVTLARVSANRDCGCKPRPRVWLQTRTAAVAANKNPHRTILASVRVRKSNLHVLLSNANPKDGRIASPSAFVAGSLGEWRGEDRGWKPQLRPKDQP